MSLNKFMIGLCFWLHFIFSLTSHIMVPIMIGGVLKMIWSSELGFWMSGLVLGATFFSSTYIINHITSEDGFCVLTALENYYRKREGLPTIGRFLPRFYKLIRRWFQWKKQS